MGIGNCQDWLMGALQILEDVEVIRKEDGETEFWREMINCGHEKVAKKVRARGRKWIPRPERFDHEGPVDAAWGKEEAKVAMGKGGMENVRSMLEAKMGGKGMVISSPFFSKSRPVAEKE
jgi:hypothetical protein